jgi:CTP:molybdopterin cytidylyltransferase MocA
VIDIRQQKIAAVILAAGEGKRFGGPKALAKLGGETFLEIIVRNLRGIADDIVVVGGSEYERIKTESERLGVQSALNPDWPEGQFTSLKVGLMACSNEYGGYFIVLVDHPMVEPETYRMLKSYFLRNPDKIIIPVRGGKRGHPLIIPDFLKGQIIAFSGETSLRDILRNCSHQTHELPVEDSGILRDIDTAKDLEPLR